MEGFSIQSLVKQATASRDRFGVTEDRTIIMDDEMETLTDRDWSVRIYSPRFRHYSRTADVVATSRRPYGKGRFFRRSEV